jgi:hypothetical protein
VNKISIGTKKIKLNQKNQIYGYITEGKKEKKGITVYMNCKPLEQVQKLNI